MRERLSLLRATPRLVISVMCSFLLPGSHCTAARHFLCRATAQSVDVETQAHAAFSALISGSDRKKASRSGARIRVLRPSLRAGRLLLELVCKACLYRSRAWPAPRERCTQHDQLRMCP